MAERCPATCSATEASISGRHVPFSLSRRRHCRTKPARKEIHTCNWLRFDTRRGTVGSRRWSNTTTQHSHLITAQWQCTEAQSVNHCSLILKTQVGCSEFRFVTKRSRPFHHNVDTASAINCRHELDDPMPVATVRLRYHASPQRPRVPATARVLVLRAQVNMVTPAHDSCFPRPGCRQPLSRPTDEQGFLSRNDSNQSIFVAFVRLTGRVLSTGVTETVKSRDSSSYTACIQHRP